MALISVFLSLNAPCKKYDFKLEAALSIYPSEVILDSRPDISMWSFKSPVENLSVFLNVLKLPILTMMKFLK